MAIATMRRFLVTLILVGTFLAATESAYADAPWQCGGPADPGHCWWGYNHVTPSVNYWVAGPTNWWYAYEFVKQNGGTATFAMYSYTNGGWCLRNISGTGWFTMFPAYDGCGGYNRPYVGYYSGNSSYVRSDVWAG